MSIITRSWLTDLLLLTLMTALLYGCFLGMRPLAPPDEGRYSEIPREMVVSGDYLTPHLNGVQYFEKPILFYWLQSLSIKVFGMHEWSLRLINALMGVVGCLITYAGTRKLYDRGTAFLASVILATMLLYSALSCFITLDITMTTFLTGSLLSFLVANQHAKGIDRRYYLWGMYGFAALATLTKGLVGILFPGMIIFTWLLVTQNWRQLSSYHLISGTFLFLAITLPWHILVGLKNPGFFHFYFYEQHFLRYLTDYAKRSQPLWFLPSVLVLGTFPWTGFLVCAMTHYSYIWKNVRQYATQVYLILWASLIFIFYCLSHSQLVPYLLPVLPPLAIMTACYIKSNWEKKNRALSLSFVYSGLISLLLGVTFLIYTTKNVVFIPLSIQIVFFIVTVINAVLCNFVYHRYNFKRAVIVLFSTTFSVLICGYLCSSYFDSGSVKPLALEVKKVIKPGDAVYNYNHYHQDMPVYLEQPIILLNWKGELLFGSRHQPPPGTFIHENRLWESWQTEKRKFLVMEIRDFNNIRSILKNLTFYPIAYTQKFVVISNKDVP